MTEATPKAEAVALQPKAYRMSAGAVLAAVAVEPKAGLSAAEASKRLVRHGPNELVTERPLPPWRRFLAQFQDALVLLLLVATAISATLWAYERESSLPYEAIAIFAVVLLNALLGYFQEARAASAVAALRKMAAAHAHVIRDGERHDVLATEVVAGDIIVIEEGDTVPADARLLQAAALQTAESSLTGESLPVAKDLLEIATSWPPAIVTTGVQRTAVTHGRGRPSWSRRRCRRRWGGSPDSSRRPRPRPRPCRRSSRAWGVCSGSSWS